MSIEYTYDGLIHRMDDEREQPEQPIGPLMLRYLRDHGEATSEELARHFELDQALITNRLGDMCRRGRVEVARRVIVSLGRRINVWRAV